jgi:preprotein translocase subunit SecF
MEFFRIRRTIPFMRHALVFNVISAIVFVAAVVSRGIVNLIYGGGGTRGKSRRLSIGNVDWHRNKVAA